jgi:hypothetical protein
MSAPVAAEVLREMGARTRSFKCLEQAICWWTDERARRGCRALPVQMGSGPRSQASIDETNATFAMLTQCLAERHPADVEDWPLSSWRVEALAAWYASGAIWMPGEMPSDNGRTFLAERLGWSVEVCERFMGETASVLRRRMQARGLIP